MKKSKINKNNNENPEPKRKFKLTDLIFFCKCKEPDSIISQQNKENNSKILLKDSNYSQNNIINFQKIEKEEAKSEKKSFKKEKASIFQSCAFFPNIEEISDELENFPEKELFFLKKEGFLIITRMISLNIKNIFSNKQMRMKKSKSFYNANKDEKLSKTQNFMQIFSFVSEKVLEQIGKRIKEDQIILCLDLKSSIQLALNGFMNICVSNKINYKQFLKNFSEFSNFKQTIEIISSGFEEFKLTEQIKRFIGIIFINCEEIFRSEIDSNKDFSGKLNEIIKKSLSICQNLIILLPKKFKFTHLVRFFSDNIDANQEALFKSYSIEIELVKLNDNLEKYMVYYGSCNSIKHNEEKNCLSFFLNSDNFMDYTQKNLLILNLIDKLGVYKCCKIISQIKISTEKTILQTFLDLLIKENLLSSEEILDMIHEKLTPKLKRQVSWKSNRISSRYMTHESDSEKKASCSQIGSIYTDNFYEISSEIQQERLSLMRSTMKKDTRFFMKKTFV